MLIYHAGHPQGTPDNACPGELATVTGDSPQPQLQFHVHGTGSSIPSEVSAAALEATCSMVPPVAKQARDQTQPHDLSHKRKLQPQV